MDMKFSARAEIRHIFPAVIILTLFLTACFWAGAVEAKQEADALTPDGGRYYGPVVNGMRHGQGKVEWDNGAVYEGGFEDGLYSGKGRLRQPSGEIFEGNFKQGMLEGSGRYMHPNGLVYIGQFHKDELHGYGRTTSPDGYTYSGNFEKGQQTGKGRLVGHDEEYVGSFRYGQYSGYGKWKHKDGRQYQGNFLRGQYHGIGKYTTPDGEIYEGEFVKGEFTGNGIHKYPNGSVLKGKFVNWMAEGPGVFTDAAGNIYEGVFEQDALNGKGRMKAKDGSRYEGEFEYWKYHGQGIYTAKNGDTYQGSFKYGMFDGEGTYHYASPQQDGSTEKKGTWKYGKPADAEKQIEARIENALYNQSTLLNNALSRLKGQEPGRIDLYLLAVGGDGSQEVFRRETEFVQKQFDRDFGTQGRSLVLSNSREASERLPMATVTSIRKSLQEIAGKMDKEEDILFLFLTSHGSKKHDLSLAQDGMNIRQLGAADLGQMLRETGIRWKVIVVSACYSGGFIDPLKDDHTLIITAARHDRTSFGCADENDFTYFGKAFFEEGLPTEKSFESAFEKAKLLIREREEKNFREQKGKKEENQHSEPQIYSPEPIREYLLRWQAESMAREKGALKSAALVNP